MSDGSSSIQAMQALSRAQRVTANNVANVNTDGFEPSRTHLEDGPGGEGVAVSAITKTNAIDAPYRQEQTSATGATREPSRTEIAREMVDLVRNQRAFSANAAFYRNMSDSLGLIVDLKT